MYFKRGISLYPPLAVKHTRNRQTRVDDMEPDEMREKKVLLQGPYEYHMTRQGKCLREKFTRIVGRQLKVETEVAKIVTNVLSTLHNASLLVDDIEDGSNLRRGQQAAYLKFGIPLTLNAANWKYFDALSTLMTLSETRGVMVETDAVLSVVRIFSEEMRNAHRGQALDIYWRESLKCPSEKDYEKMISLKTTTLFRAAYRMLAVFASSSSGGDDDDLRWHRLIKTMGLFFQIRDDVANLVLYADQKGFCDDIEEGKFSFPMVLAVKSPLAGTEDSAERLLAIMRKGKNRKKELKYDALQCLDRCGALKGSMDRLRDLRKEIFNVLKTLNPSEELGLFIASFVSLDDVSGACSTFLTKTTPVSRIVETDVILERKRTKAPTNARNVRTRRDYPREKRRDRSGEMDDDTIWPIPNELQKPEREGETQDRTTKGTVRRGVQECKQ